MDPVKHTLDNWGQMYPAAQQAAVDHALATIMTAMILDEDFNYFEMDDRGHACIDGHLDLTPEQIAAVRSIQGRA